jgi:hypothetical protein
MVMTPDASGQATVAGMAQQIGGSRSKSVDHLLRVAIAQKRLVTFSFKGLTRRAEPHDYGISNGTAKLFFYQVGGESSSAAPFGWRWATVSEISNLEILDGTFSGSRPAVSGRHVHWDLLMASVSDRPGVSALRRR